MLRYMNRVLVVTAHPDDLDFGCAGSVARWVGEGAEVTYCIVTNGDAGGFDRSVSRADMAALRQAEQRAAAAEVGVDDVRFLGYPDGRLAVSFELRRDIARVIRQARPERVVTQSPERNYRRIYASHPDHLAAGEATLAAVYPDARNAFAHPELLDEEGLEPHEVAEVWLMGTPQAEQVVDVTDTFDAKMAALRAHKSQTSHLDDLEDFLRRWLAETASAAGLPQGRLAEAFQVVDTR